MKGEQAPNHEKYSNTDATESTKSCEIRIATSILFYKTHMHTKIQTSKSLTNNLTNKF